MEQGESMHTVTQYDVQAEKHQLMKEYVGNAITEARLLTLASYDKAIALECGTQRLSKMGVAHKGCLQPDGSLWVAVQSTEDADELKPILRGAGYSNLRTFEGWMGWCPSKRLLLQASKETYFDDSLGRSARLYEMVCRLGVMPMYTCAFAGKLAIDFDSEQLAIALYQKLTAQRISCVAVQPDDMSSLDVWQVSCGAK